MRRGTSSGGADGGRSGACTECDDFLLWLCVSPKLNCGAGFLAAEYVVGLGLFVKCVCVFEAVFLCESCHNGGGCGMAVNRVMASESSLAGLNRKFFMIWFVNECQSVGVWYKVVEVSEECGYSECVI